VPVRVIARTYVVGAREIREALHHNGHDTWVFGPDAALGDVWVDGKGGDAAARGGWAAA